MHDPTAPAWTGLLRAVGRSGLPGRHRLVSAVAPCRPDRGVVMPFEVDLHDTGYRGNLAEFIDWNIFYFGSYAMGELTFLDACSRYLRRVRGSVHFFDIRANVGELSTLMATRATTVSAFEPSRDLERPPESTCCDERPAHDLGPCRRPRRARSRGGARLRPPRQPRLRTWTLPGAAVETVEVKAGDAYSRTRAFPGSTSSRSTSKGTKRT